MDSSMVRGTELGATPAQVYTRCVADFQGRASRLTAMGFKGESYAWSAAQMTLARLSGWKERHRSAGGELVFVTLADWARERAGRADVERRSAPDMARWTDAESRVAAYRAVRSFALDCAGLCRSVGY